MGAVGIQRQVADADDGIEVYLAVDVGVYLAGTAGLALDLGLEADDVHVEDYEAGGAGVETFNDAEGLGLVLRAVDEPFIGQAGRLVLPDGLRRGPGIGCGDVIDNGQDLAPNMVLGATKAVV